MERSFLCIFKIHHNNWKRCSMQAGLVVGSIMTYHKTLAHNWVWLHHVPSPHSQKESCVFERLRSGTGFQKFVISGALLSCIKKGWTVSKVFCLMWNFHCLTGAWISWFRNVVVFKAFWKKKKHFPPLNRLSQKVCAFYACCTKNRWNPESVTRVSTLCISNEQSES